MSLETQVAELVTSAKKLVSEIAGKMAGIDKKVDEATASVPNTIRSLSTQNFYVDAVNGNDANDGSRERPIKTINRLSSLAIAGSYITVHLMGGQTHAIVGNGMRLASGGVHFRSWNQSELGKPLIKLTLQYVEASNENRGYILHLNTGLVFFGGVNIELVNPDNGYRRSGLDGGIYNLGCSVSVLVLDSKITLNDAPLIASDNNGGRSVTDLSMGNVVVEVERNTNGSAKLISGRNVDQPVYKLAVQNVSFSSNLRWRDLVPINSTKNNLITNIPTDQL